MLQLILTHNLNYLGLDALHQFRLELVVIVNVEDDGVDEAIVSTRQTSVDVDLDDVLTGLLDHWVLVVDPHCHYDS